MIHCCECVYGFFYGGCGMSPGNAACLTRRKPYWQEPKEKLLEYLQRVENYEDGHYQEIREKIKRYREEIAAR